MPLVLAGNERSESGIRYADRTGVSYQFPKMYRGLIQPGERFVYYRGRGKIGGGRQLQVYFGVGLIGHVGFDPSNENRMLCDILDYRPFAAPVPFKRGATDYWETGAARRGYFQKGVRAISDAEFEQIIAAAGSAAAAEPTLAALWQDHDSPDGGAVRGSPERTREIERFSVEIVASELRSRHPLALVEVQPRNNPGFDILVEQAGGKLYVEVKGTGRNVPVFFMTEGERRFSQRHAGSYCLAVVYAIDTKTGAFRTFWHEGPITEHLFALSPVQWVCEVRQGEPYSASG